MDGLAGASSLLSKYFLMSVFHRSYNVFFVWLPEWDTDRTLDETRLPPANQRRRFVWADRITDRSKRENNESWLQSYIETALSTIVGVLQRQWVPLLSHKFGANEKTRISTLLHIRWSWRMWLGWRPVGCLIFPELKLAPWKLQPPPCQRLATLTRSK